VHAAGLECNGFTRGDFKTLDRKHPGDALFDNGPVYFDVIEVTTLEGADDDRVTGRVFQSQVTGKDIGSGWCLADPGLADAEHRIRGKRLTGEQTDRTQNCMNQTLHH